MKRQLRNNGRENVEIIKIPRLQVWHEEYDV